MQGHAACVEFMKSFNVPLFCLGGGGYTIRNVARTWAYETAVLLGEKLDPSLPYNDYYDFFGPEYTLDVPASNMTNMNTRQQLEQLCSEIHEHLHRIPHAPSVQMQQVPRDWPGESEESDNLPLCSLIIADGEFYYGDEVAYEGDEYECEQDESELITQEDYWTLISRYFDEHGLVRQQIDSFNNFIENTLQEIIDENPNIVMEKTIQGNQNQDVIKRYHIGFGQCGYQTLVADLSDPRNLNVASVADMVMDVVDNKGHFNKSGELVTDRTEFIGNGPSMLQSDFCNLHNMETQQLYANGECPYDQGGYFIINGSEKVLIAQERIGTNTVLVFRKTMPYPHYAAEIRSQAERVSKLANPLSLNLKDKASLMVSAPN
ncbi:DNA-dependent RNA polymerase II [Coemansia sp. RSA 560]|nr:DNA-dependent RNA polymerase II [Coemansia sp. RSA 560]